MKISKLDRQQKLFDLYKVLGSIDRVTSANGDIILDDELKAAVFGVLEPAFKRRISKGELLPVFQGSEAMRIEPEGDTHLQDDLLAVHEEDSHAVGVGETPLADFNGVKIVDYVEPFVRPDAVDQVESKGKKLKSEKHSV
ncbi:MAG: hypothetical protein [Microviridae sp.]|nr:MAG: hypothetical protein [Microviridae sp.]